MMLFNTLINFVEAFCFSLFIAYYFKIEERKLYIIVMTIVQLLFLTYGNIIDYSGLWLTVCIVLSIVLSLILINKNTKFDYIYIPVLYNMLILISSFISVFFGRPIGFFLSLNDTLSFIMMCTVAKIIQAMTTILAIKKGFTFSLTLDMKEWSSILMTDIFMFAALAIMQISLFYENYSIITFQLLFLIIFLAVVSYRSTISKISKLNEEKIEYVKVHELAKYNQEKLDMMNHMKNDIASADHRMTYMLYQMEQLLKGKKYEQLETSLHRYRDLMSKYKMVTDTKNPVFDCLYSLKINDLIAQGKDIRNSIFISSKDEYNNILFINHLTDVIDLFSKCQNIFISMNEYGKFLSIKIIFQEGKIDENEVRRLCDTYFKDNGSYNMEDYQTRGLRISINMAKKYGQDID